METFVHTLDIDAPAEDVWTIIADHARDPEWRDDVSWTWSEPAGPAQVGTRAREVRRVGGRRYASERLVEAVEPGRSFSWKATDGPEARGSRTVTPLSGGRCEVELRLHVHPAGLDRVLGPILRASLTKAGEQDLQALAELVASRRAPQPTPA